MFPNSEHKLPLNSAQHMYQHTLFPQSTVVTQAKAALQQQPRGYSKSQMWSPTQVNDSP